MEEINTNVNITQRDGQLFIEIPINMEMMNDIYAKSKQLSEEEQLQKDLSIGRSIQNENGKDFGEKFINYCEKKGIESMRHIKELKDYRELCKKRKDSPEKLTQEEKEILNKFDNNPIINEVDKLFENAGLIKSESQNIESDLTRIACLSPEEYDGVLKRQECKITELIEQVEKLKKEKEKLVFELGYYKNDNSNLKEKLENIKELI